MKSIAHTVKQVAALLGAVIVLFTNSSLAEDKPEFDPHTNISGLWQDSPSDTINNGYVIISQQDNAIFVAHYLEWKGQPLVEHGAGVRDGDTIHYAVKVTREIPGWANAGTHHLTLSEDGNTLSGHYKDNLGNTGPIAFVRKGM